MAKHELTDPFIRHHPAPEKRIEISDSSYPGLVIRITPKGAKTFVYRYRYGSRIIRYTIGSFSKISLSAARKEVDRLYQMVKMGKNPQSERLKMRNDADKMTIRQCVELYKKERISKLKVSTQKDYKSRIERHIIPYFGHMALIDVHRTHIKYFLKPISEKQPVQANRLQAILSSIFSYAVNEELTTNHPLKKLQKFGAETRRNRFYSKDEVWELWKAFEQQPEPMQSLFKILLLTGQRLGETSRMKWVDIDAGRALWIIPQVETKAGRGHFVPIIGSFSKILENIHPLTGHLSHVFSSPMNSIKPLTSFKEAVERVRKISGVTDFRLHDLRRTAATFMAELGTDRTTLGKILNHKGLSGDSHVTSIYDRHDYMNEKIKALTKWDSYLVQLLTAEKSEKKAFKIG